MHAHRQARSVCRLVEMLARRILQLIPQTSTMCPSHPCGSVSLTSSQRLHELQISAAPSITPAQSIPYNLYLYRAPLLVNSHVAHNGTPGPPGRIRVLSSITTPAAHPPTIAVTVKYVFSRAVALFARSTPPGIADNLCTVIITITIRGTGRLLERKARGGDVRVHRDAADGVEYVGGLPRLHADGDGDLQPQSPAVYVRLHFMSLAGAVRL